MTERCDISINLIRNDKIQVEIKHKYCDTRKFEIVANKEGLRISSDKNIAVLPVTSNTVMIDDAIDVNTDSNKVVNTNPSSSPTLVV